MSFLSLTPAEFLALFSALGGLVTALYLLDRSRTSRVVSTMRFFAPGPQSDQQRSRRRVREPWSLLLQLLGLLLLLLALAELQWGARGERGRDHVLIVDCSSWMSKQLDGTTLIDRARSLAIGFLNRVPSRDRVMLVRADGLTSPVTRFTADRSALIDQVQALRPSFTALNLTQALAFADRARRWPGRQAGEIVYVGSNRVAALDGLVDLPDELHAVLVPDDGVNVGIRRVVLHRSAKEAGAWQAAISLHNYGPMARSLQLLTRYGSTRLSGRRLRIEPQSDLVAEYSFTTRGAGRFSVSLNPADGLASDDQALLDLPRPDQFRVAVFTSRPQVWAPLFAADSRLATSFHPPGESTGAVPSADILVFDRTAPGLPAALPALYLMPPPERSPRPVLRTASHVGLTRWLGDSPLTAGIRSKDWQFGDAQSFETQAGDQEVASSGASVVALVHTATARDPSRFALLGFDPLATGSRFQTTTPLLFINLLRWLVPDYLRTVDYSVDQVGILGGELEAGERADAVELTDQTGRPIPFSVRRRAMEFYVSEPTRARLRSAGHESRFVAVLPEVALAQWQPPASVLGLPPGPPAEVRAIDLWRLLAGLGALAFLTEWTLFGGLRAGSRRPTPGRTRSPAARDEELVGK